MRLINILFILFLTTQLNAQSNLIIPDFFSKASTSKINGDLILVGNKSNQATILILNSSNVITLAKKIPSIDNISAVIEKNNSIYISGTANKKQQILKLNSSGVVIWAKETQDTFDLQEPFLKIYGDTLLSGFLSNDAMHLSNLDTNGNVNWTKTIPSITTNTYNIKGDSWKSGNDIYVAFLSMLKMRIAKISSNGNLLWHRQYSTTGFNPIYMNKTICKSTNRFIINGNLQYNPFIFEIDSLGNLIQAKSFDHNDANYNLSAELIFKNNSFYLTGFHDDPTQIFQIYHHYIAQLDTNYNLLNQIEVGNWTNLKMLNNSISFHNSQFEYARNYGNLNDTTELLRFQNLNQIVCDTSISNTTIINHSNFTLTTFTTLNTGPAYITIAAASVPASISFSFGCPIMSTNENIIGNLEIYPNPNNGQFSLELPDINNISTLEIYNSLGQKIHSEKIIPNENYKNLNLNLESGIYFILLESENEIISRSKMIIE